MSNVGIDEGKVKDTIHDAGESAKRGMSWAANSAERVQARTQDTLNRTQDSIGSMLNRIEDQVSDIWGTVSRQSSHSIDVIERNVEGRPWTVMAIAFLAGAAIGQAYRLSNGRERK